MQATGAINPAGVGRRRLDALLLAVILWLAAGVIGALPGAGRAAEAAEGQAFRILVVTWRGCEEACTGFKNYFAKHDIPVEFIMRDAQQNAERAAEIALEARSLTPDLIATWGNTTTLAMVGPYDAVDPARHITDIPVVYFYVTQAQKSKIARDRKKTGRPNVAGTDYTVPIPTQLKAIRAYRPYKVLGTVYDPTQEASVRRKEIVAEFAKRLKFTFAAVPTPLGPDGTPDIDRLEEAVAEVAAQGAQFLYFGYSSFLIRNVQTFTSLAVKHKLPVFSAGSKPLREGEAVLGLFTKLSHIGELAGHQAEAILVAGKPAASLPIARFNRYTFLINMRVAKALSLYPPVSMLRYADLIH